MGLDRQILSKSQNEEIKQIVDCLPSPVRCAVRVAESCVVNQGHFLLISHLRRLTVALCQRGLEQAPAIRLEWGLLRQNVAGCREDISAALATLGVPFFGTKVICIPGLVQPMQPWHELGVQRIVCEPVPLAPCEEPNSAEAPLMRRMGAPTKKLVGDGTLLAKDDLLRRGDCMFRLITDLLPKSL